MVPNPTKLYTLSKCFREVENLVTAQFLYGQSKLTVSNNYKLIILYLPDGFVQWYMEFHYSKLLLAIVYYVIATVLCCYFSSSSAVALLSG